MPCSGWLEKVALPPQKIKTLPLDPEIAVDATRLPGPMVNAQGKPHKGSADQIIAATAHHHSLNVLTSDLILLNYSHLKTQNSR